MSYTDTLAALAASTETAVVTLHARFDAGQLTEAQFVALATAALVRAGARGTALADLALAAALTVQRRRPVPTVGLAPATAAPAAAAAVTALLASDPYQTDPRAAVAVLGRAEALTAAQTAYGKAMREQGVRSWTRVLNTGGCPLCADLTGDVLPAAADMYTHRGCGCTQRPVD